MTDEQQMNAAIAGLMAADRLRATAGNPAPSTRSGLFGAGYDISPAKTNHWHQQVTPSDFGYPRGWANVLHGAWPDTFVAHSHPSFDLDPNFDQADRKSHLPGIADLQIYADGTVRCIPGK